MVFEGGEMKPVSRLVLTGDDRPSLGPNYHHVSAGAVAARIPHDQASAGTEGLVGPLENAGFQLGREVVQHVTEQQGVAGGPSRRQQVAFGKT